MKDLTWERVVSDLSFARGFFMGGDGSWRLVMGRDSGSFAGEVKAFLGW